MLVWIGLSLYVGRQFLVIIVCCVYRMFGVNMSVSVSVTEMSTVRHHVYGLHVCPAIFLC
jgi:hypothetical protein